MGTLKSGSGSNHDMNELDGWDPRKDDYLDHKNSTIYGSNFTRSNNLARNKETAHETHGLFVKSIPLEIDQDSLCKMFSEHGNVISVFIGKPKTEHAHPKTWGIIKVETMKDAVAMIAAMNMKPPLWLKVELALTEEQKNKRKQDKEREKEYQNQMETIVSKRLNVESLQPNNQIQEKEAENFFHSKSHHQPNDLENVIRGMGRGKKLTILAKEPCVNSPGPSTYNSISEEPTPKSTPINESPRQKVVVETNIGKPSVGWKQPRPCVAEDCKMMGKLRCSVCKAFYCSKDCQLDDWFFHSKLCKEPPVLENYDLTNYKEKCMASDVNSNYDAQSPQLAMNGLGETSKCLNKVTPTLCPLKRDVSVTPKHKENERPTTCISPDMATNNISKPNHGRNRLTGLNQENMRRPFLKEQEITTVEQSVNVERIEEQVSSRGGGVLSDSSSLPFKLKSQIRNSSDLLTGISSLQEDHSQISNVEDKMKLSVAFKSVCKDDSLSRVSISQSDANMVELMPKVKSVFNFDALPCLFEEIEVNTILDGLITVKESYQNFCLLITVESAHFLLTNTNSILDKSPCHLDFEPVVGSLVAAKSIADQCWYRAYLYDDQDEFDVIYIDFGNREKIKEIKSIPEGRLSSLPGIAVVAKMHGVLSNECAEALKNLIKVDQNIKMKVMGKKAKSLKVALLASDNETGTPVAHFILRPWYTALNVKRNEIEKSDSNKLKDKNKQISVDEKIEAVVPKLDLSISPSKFIEIVPPPGENAVASEKSLKINPMCKVNSQAKPPLKFWFRDLPKTKVDLDKEYQVIPIWIDDDYFYVHLVSEYQADLSHQLLSIINEHVDQATKPSSIEVGELVCGFHTEDGAWYRTEVLEVKERVITAHFVDYGNSGMLALQNIRSFCADLMAFPITAVQVKLSGLSNIKHAESHLSSLIQSGDILTMRSAKGGDPLMFELYDKEINLNHLILSNLNEKQPDKVTNGEEKKVAEQQKLEVLSPSERKETVKKSLVRYEDCELSPIKLGKDVEVVIIHITGPHGIYMVAIDAIHLYDDLEKVNGPITQYCESRTGSLYRPQQAEICLARFSQDGIWYRAACLDPRLETCVVFFVDYGNTEEVQMSDLRKIEDVFLKVPCIALHAVLKDVSGNDVQKGAKDRLVELLPLNTPTKIDVEMDEGNEVYVINTPSVINTLVKEGLVKTTKS